MRSRHLQPVSESQCKDTDTDHKCESDQCTLPDYSIVDHKYLTLIDNARPQSEDLNPVDVGASTCDVEIDNVAVLRPPDAPDDAIVDKLLII